MPRVRSRNQCSCCKKSSSSERPSSSTDPSYDPPSSDDPSSDDPSSDDPSSSSQKSSYDVGKCCALPTDYIVDSEIYPSNQFDEAQEWIRSQRSGREGVGFMFHGPIRLRFDGGWFVAVICVGKVLGDGTCECDDEVAYTCEEIDDPGYCYYLSGIPGLGVFTENERCECVGSGSEDVENCDDCSGTFEDCEIGCTESGCGCCYEEPPPAGEDGVACSKRFKVLGFGEIKTQYPEILQDADCLNPEQAADGSPIKKMIDDLVDQKDVLRDSIRVASFREDCRIEVWGECPCVPESTCQGPCTKQCYDADEVDVDVFDEWQANQLGMEWKAKDVDGECPEACQQKGICCYEISGQQDGEFHFDNIDDAVSFAEGQELAYVIYYPGSAAGATGPDDVVVETVLWDPVVACGERPESLCNGLNVINYDNPTDGLGVYQSATERGLKWFDPEEFPNLTCADSPCAACPCPREDLVSGEFVVDLRTNSVIFRGCTGCENAPPDGSQVPVPGGTINDLVAEWVGGNYFDYCSTLVQNLGFAIRYSFTVSDPPPCGQQSRKNEMPQPQPKKKTKGGAGTELTKLLKFFGIEATEKGCKCKSRAAKMDKNGIEWSSNNVEKICDWLHEEAQKRKLPFLRTAARVIVLRAIRNARKAEEV